ncbi:hypothetical protein AVKW3434_13310 [Acidovorax sp. SUPP3434]|uniref:hypothetical protein n=1 Tax=Acidovorax sp. SUPP3434 TaxID=2920880 RepID=UPI0023DE2D3E|nr:hypothetical protein [Acidovorax sp. SUPP3434]GKT00373.1 hypothetical protein AVKW3434_13310 [Acidovorax sp. SUPP3434]
MEEQNINMEGTLAAAPVAANEAPPEVGQPAEGQVAALKRILVVDDELAGLRREHLNGVNPDFYDVISDVNDPRFEHLRQVGLAVPSIAELMNGDIHEVADYFGSDDAVSNLILSDAFAQGAHQDLRALLNPFIERAARVKKLEVAMREAFPASQFVIEIRSAPRPPADDVLLFDALFLDLFLENGEANPVVALATYMRSVSQAAAGNEIPPIVLMSSHDELEQNRQSFSEKSQISAAGLLILPKQKITSEAFGAPGLRLGFDQLTRQRPAAREMRLFMANWLSALDAAKTKASATLWNLDAAAMQQIHFASVSDDDPFDQHLHEMLAREHLVHIEEDASVSASMAKLDCIFRELLSADGKAIENRLIAPTSDVHAMRSLISHFTWIGALPPVSFISSDVEAAKNISHSLPFGSVLAGPGLKTGSICLVHITQQCDLNGISRDKDINGCLIFARARARQLQIWEKPDPSTRPRLVARNLKFDDGAGPREFDLDIDVGQVLALPLVEVVQRAREQSLRVIGRLRGDIASHVVADTSNHISRSASQKMIRPAMLKAKVFLQEPTLNKGVATVLEKDGKAKVFSLLFESDQYSFQDDACVWLSLWLRNELAKLGIAADADVVCTALRKGWRADRQLAGILTTRVKGTDALNTAFKALVAGEAAAGQPQLTIVFERGA